MTGRDYFATVQLSDRDGELLAGVGESCELVPESSLPWLIEQRLILPFADFTPIPDPEPGSPEDGPQEEG
jgi:hypothetical protein